MSNRCAPETDALRRPRHFDDHRHKNTGTRQVLCTIWPVLQSGIKPRHAGFLWPEEDWPHTEPGFSQGFFLHFCHWWEFWFLATVTFGLLSWGRLTDCTDTIGRELNWMMTSLKHQWTDFSWKNGFCYCPFVLLTNYFLFDNQYCIKICFVYCVETCWYRVWSRSVSRILSVSALAWPLLWKK